MVTLAMARPVTAAERIKREDYFRAAFELLAEGGKPALTTTSVCERLGVTTGSLYHHFQSGPGFYAAFIEHWENDVSPALRKRADSAADPQQRLDVLMQIARDGDHDAEKAIRAWSAVDPIVAAAQARVDAVRHAHLSQALADAGIAPDRAATLARIGFAILIGSQQLETPVDRTRLTAALDEYAHWVRHRTRTLSTKGNRDV